MTKIYIAGVGMTQMGKLLDRSVKSLTAEAVGAALKDGGIAKGEASQTESPRCESANQTGGIVESEMSERVSSNLP